MLSEAIDGATDDDQHGIPDGGAEARSAVVRVTPEGIQYPSARGAYHLSDGGKPSSRIARALVRVVGRPTGGTRGARVAIDGARTRAKRKGVFKTERGTYARRDSYPSLPTISESGRRFRGEYFRGSISRGSRAGIIIYWKRARVRGAG